MKSADPRTWFELKKAKQFQSRLCYICRETIKIGTYFYYRKCDAYKAHKKCLDKLNLKRKFAK